MKNILLILMLIAPSLVKCQVTSNIISETEFNNIKINNVTLSAIKATNGDYTLISNLTLGTITENTQEQEVQYYYYIYNGFNISFSENEMSSFEITNNNWNINIQGNIVTIGSDISTLGNVVVNNDIGGGKSIIYQYCDGCNNYIFINFDTSTNKITEIGFIEQT